jgi:hypothetical protein
MSIEWITRSRRRLFAACALALAVGTAPTFLRTFVNDDVTYVLIGQKLNAGGRLYRDAVDNKPPLIYATAAAAAWMAGPHAAAAFKLLTAAVHLGCAALLFLIGRRLFGPRVGARAALFFAIAVVTGIAEDFPAANTEAYMNLFVLGAVARLARDPERPSRGALVAAGALVGIATLYRVQGAAALLGALIFLTRRGRPVRLRLAGVAWMVLGFVLPLLSTLAYLAARGTLGDFWTWAILGNVSYVRLGAAHFGWRPILRIALVVASQFPLLAVAVPAGVAWLRIREPDRTRAELIWIQLLTALFGYQMGSRFYGHYVLQVVPFLALIAAWAHVQLPRFRFRTLRLTPFLLALWLVTFAAINTVRLSAMRDEAGSADAVAFLRATTGPDDEVLLWSASGELAYAAHRCYASRFPFNSYLTGRIFGTAHALPGASRETNRTTESDVGWRMLEQDLAVAAPAVVIDGAVPGFELFRYPLLRDYVQRLYGPPHAFGRLVVYRRLCASDVNTTSMRP